MSSNSGSPRCWRACRQRSAGRARPRSSPQTKAGVCSPRARSVGASAITVSSCIRLLGARKERSARSVLAPSGCWTMSASDVQEQAAARGARKERSARTCPRRVVAPPSSAGTFMRTPGASDRSSRAPGSGRVGGAPVSPQGCGDHRAAPRRSAKAPQRSPRLASPLRSPGDMPPPCLLILPLGTSGAHPCQSSPSPALLVLALGTWGGRRCGLLARTIGPREMEAARPCAGSRKPRRRPLRVWSGRPVSPAGDALLPSPAHAISSRPVSPAGDAPRPRPYAGSAARLTNSNSSSFGPRTRAWRRRPNGAIGISAGPETSVPPAAVSWRASASTSSTS